MAVPLDGRSFGRETGVLRYVEDCLHWLGVSLGLLGFDSYLVCPRYADVVDGDLEGMFVLQATEPR